eukprot:794060-Prorocentrum_minimum.AAC.2
MNTTWISITWSWFWINFQTPGLKEGLLPKHLAIFGRQWLMTFGTSLASKEGTHSPHGPNGLTTDR